MPKASKYRPRGAFLPPSPVPSNAKRYEAPDKEWVASRGGSSQSPDARTHSTRILDGGDKKKLVPCGLHPRDAIGLAQCVAKGELTEGTRKTEVVGPGNVDSWEMRQIAHMVAAFNQYGRIHAMPEQVNRNVNTVKAFLVWAQIENLDGITRAAVQDYLAHLGQIGRSPKTIRNHHGSLSAFCRFLADRGVLPSNPCQRMQLPRIEKRVPVFLNDKECAQALSLARKHGIYAEVCTALHTGLRLNELRMLRWEDVDLAGRSLLVRKSKSGRPRQVWLNTKALAALQEQREKYGRFEFVFPGGRGMSEITRGSWGRNRPRRRKWWTTKALLTLQARIPKFSEAAPGTAGRGFHLFRHTFASHLAQHGVSLFKISVWLGHSDVKTTQVYAHLSPDFDEEIEKV